MPALDFDHIKKLTIIAMFSDDDLMDSLVLKGGNVLDIVYGIAQRASIDLDFSIENQFRDLEAVTAKVRRALEDTFAAAGYQAFDVRASERPATVSPQAKDFWGGYRFDFKIIERQRYDAFAHDLARLRRNATLVGERQRRTFAIDVSKFEYCAPKRPSDFEGYRIYVYTPAMIVFEKLRAICQQMPEYADLLGKARTARARDFFDIHTVDQHYPIDFRSPESLDLVRRIFDAKRVSLELIAGIPDYREYHRPDFSVVCDTVKPGFKLKEFDFYFDYVVDKCAALEPLWNE